MAKKKPESFEDSLKQLQEIVEKLERGDLPLEDAMDSFTDGVRLARQCRVKLEEAENRVQMLIKDDQGNWTTGEFDPSGNESAG